MRPRDSVYMVHRDDRVQQQQKAMGAGRAVYLAGVAFSFGIRLGQMPLPRGEAEVLEFGFWLLVNLALSVAFSWLGAGLALGGP